MKMEWIETKALQQCNKMVPIATEKPLYCLRKSEIKHPPMQFDVRDNSHSDHKMT